MLSAMYKIGEFSRLCQLPVRTLRYYDQIGLLVPADVVRGSGYRCYAAEQLEQVNRILVFKDLGLSLPEIRAVLADGASAAEVAELVRRKHADLARRVQAERRRLARATARLALLERGGAALADIAVRAVDTHWVASIRATLRSHDDCDALFDSWTISSAGARGTSAARSGTPAPRTPSTARPSRSSRSASPRAAG